MPKRGQQVKLRKEREICNKSVHLQDPSQFSSSATKAWRPRRRWRWEQELSRLFWGGAQHGGHQRGAQHLHQLTHQLTHPEAQAVAGSVIFSVFWSWFPIFNPYHPLFCQERLARPRPDGYQNLETFQKQKLKQKVISNSILHKNSFVSYQYKIPKTSQSKKN